MFSRTLILPLGSFVAFLVFQTSHVLVAQENESNARLGQTAVRQPGLELRPLPVFEDQVRGNTVAPLSSPIQRRITSDYSTSDYFDLKNRQPDLTRWTTSAWESGPRGLTTKQVAGDGIPDRDTNQLPGNFGNRIPATLAKSSPIRSIPAPRFQRPLTRDPSVQTVGYQESEQEEKAKPVVNQDEPSGTDANQEKKITTNANQQEPTLEELERRVEDKKKLVTDNETLDPTQKTKQLETLNKAAASLQKAKTSVQFIETQKRQLAEFESDRQRLQARIDSPAENSTPEQNKDSQTLLDELEAKQKELQKSKSKFASLKSQILDHEKRIAEIPASRLAILEEQKQLKQSLKELKEDRDNNANQIQILAMESRAFAIRNELESIDLELNRRDEVQTLLTLERTVTNQTTGRLDDEIEIWTAAQATQRERELAQQKEDAEKAYQKAINAAPALKALAERNQELVSIRSRITGDIEAIRKERDAIKLKTVDFEDNIQSIKQKVETTQMTPSLGMLLIEQRNDLTQPIQSFERIEEIANEIQRIKLASLDLKEKRSPLESTSEFIDDLVEQNEFPGTATSDVESMANDLVKTQLTYSDNLEKDYATYRRLLVEVESSHSVFIDKIHDFRNYVAHHALWIQSTNPISWLDLTESRYGCEAYFNLESWKALADLFQRRFIEKPYEPALVLFALLGLFFAKRRLKVMYV